MEECWKQFWKWHRLQMVLYWVSCYADIRFPFVKSCEFPVMLILNSWVSCYADILTSFESPVMLILNSLLSFLLCCYSEFPFHSQDPVLTNSNNASIRKAPLQTNRMYSIEYLLKVHTFRIGKNPTLNNFFLVLCSLSLSNGDVRKTTSLLLWDAVVLYMPFLFQDEGLSSWGQT